MDISKQEFIQHYNALMNNSLGLKSREWDVVPILPSVTRPVTISEASRELLAAEIINGKDLQPIQRSQDDTRTNYEVISDWISNQKDLWQKSVRSD